MPIDFTVNRVYTGSRQESLSIRQKEGVEMDEAEQKKMEEGARWMSMAVKACSGISTESLERLASAGGVKVLWKAVRLGGYKDCTCDLCNTLSNIVDAIGPLEDWAY